MGMYVNEVSVDGIPINELLPDIEVTEEMTIPEGSHQTYEV